MHEQAYDWLRSAVTSMGLSGLFVLDLGGRDVNGHVHDLFSWSVTTLDIADGPGVTIVADAADWVPDREYDVVLCTEVFEHTPRWREIIGTAYDALPPGGVFLTTCASRSRPPHSAVDGGPLVPGEYYQNISPAELADALTVFSEYGVFAMHGHFGDDDLYAWAKR